MKTVKALKEEKQSLLDEVQAITAVATDESRELSKDESARINSILGKGDQVGLADQVQAQLDQRQKIEAVQMNLAAARAEIQQPAAPAAPKARIEFPSFRGKVKSFKGPNAERDAYIAGQFYNATLFNSASSREWLKENGNLVRAAHSTGDNEKGGYLVPESTESTLIRLVEEYGVFRRNVGRVWPVQGSTRVPKRAGGFTVYHPGENEDITLSDMAFADVELTPKKAAVLTKISNELSEDALPMLGDVLTQEFAYAFAVDEDNAGFNGDGTSSFNRIVGLKNALAAGSIFDGGSGKVAAEDFILADYLSAMGKLKRYPGIMPKWYVHSEVFQSTFAKIQMATAGNRIEDIGNGPMMMFLGYPVEFCQIMPNTATDSASTIFAYFGDLSYAVEMGDARGITVASDSSIYFASDALGVRCTQRYDIQVHDKGTASASGSIIALKTAAS